MRLILILSGLAIALAACGGSDSSANKNKDFVDPIERVKALTGRTEAIRQELSDAVGKPLSPQGVDEGLWVAERLDTYQERFGVTSRLPHLIVSPVGMRFDPGSESSAELARILDITGCPSFLLPAATVEQAEVIVPCGEITDLRLAGAGPERMRASYTLNNRNVETTLVKVRGPEVQPTRYPDRTIEVSGLEYDVSLQTLFDQLKEEYESSSEKGMIQFEVNGINSYYVETTDDSATNRHMVSGVLYGFKPGTAFGIHREYSPAPDKGPTLNDFRADLAERYGEPSLDNDRQIGWSFDVDGSPLSGAMAERCLMVGSEPTIFTARGSYQNIPTRLPVRSGCGLQLLVNIHDVSGSGQGQRISLATFDLWDANSIGNHMYEDGLRRLHDFIVNAHMNYVEWQQANQ